MPILAYGQTPDIGQNNPFLLVPPINIAIEGEYKVVGVNTYDLKYERVVTVKKSGEAHIYKVYRSRYSGTGILSGDSLAVMWEDNDGDYPSEVSVYKINPDRTLNGLVFSPLMRGVSFETWQPINH